jgi:pimeloyl-ACP methyl ester carboxylesterase
MLAGASGDADAFETLLPYLIDRFTVIAYDRRGYTRSPLDPSSQAAYVSIETRSDDAARLLASFTAEPAYVFGSSLGALIGLDLTMRYPDRVRKLVAHEPPLVRLLSPAEGAASAPVARPGETVDDAIRRFTSEMGIGRETASELHQDAAEREKRVRKRKNMEFFMAHEAAGVGQYVPDFDRLKALLPQIVLTAGDAGRAYSPYVMAQRAAEKLGVPLIEFPGNHVGYLQHPKEFARQLTALFL